MVLRCSANCGCESFMARGTVYIIESSHATYEADMYLDADGGLEETDIDWDTQSDYDTDDTDISNEDWDSADIVCSECGARAEEVDEDAPPPKPKTFTDEEGNEYV